jgi:hypothetical protein
MMSLVPSPSVQFLEGKSYWRPWEARRLQAGIRLAAEKGRKPQKSQKSREVEVDFSRYTPDKYLLSWATVVSGLEPEEDGHTIVVPHSKFVNDNGNGWLNDVLLENYHSLILAENFQEHVQIPEFSRGKVLDAVAWVVRQRLPNHAEGIPTVFVDVLVATDKRKYPILCQDIRDKRIFTLSMGCRVVLTQCSQCGRVFREEKDDPCGHISENLGGYYRDIRGIRRRQAELCGVPGRPGSMMFIEVSWVRIPAFGPARLHSVLNSQPRVQGGRPLKAYVPIARVREAYDYPPGSRN